MSALAVMRGLAGLRRPLTRSISSLPAEHAIGGAGTLIGLGVMAATLLIPSCWVLSHLEDYKKRE